MYSICYDFIASCIPAEIVGNFRICEILHCVVSGNLGAVPSLEKLAAMKLVEIAMANEERRAKLTAIIRSKPILVFGPLIFGDCSPISNFIVDLIQLEDSVIPTFDRHFFFRVDPENLYFAIGLANTVAGRHPGNQVPLAKIYEFVPIILRKPLKRFSFFIDRAIPDIPAIIQNIIRLKNSSSSDLHVLRQTTNGPFSCLSFSKDPL